MNNFIHLGLLVAVHIYFTLVCKSQIVKPPSNQIVSLNDTAIFNCSLLCLQQVSVTWFITLPSSGRTVTISPYTPLNQIKNMFGIDVFRRTVNECPQGGYFVEQLFVRAKKQLNLMPVQCSTVCFGGDCMCGDSSQVHFSKLGVLSIVSAHIPQMVGTTKDISPTNTISVSPSTTALAGYLQDSAIVPSSCSSYVRTITVTLSYGAAKQTPQVSLPPSKQ